MWRIYHASGIHAYTLKLDLARPCDSVDRVKLASRVPVWCGEFFHHFQCRVKQGATESPLLFTKLVDEILTVIEEPGRGDVVEGMDCDGGAFMDDSVTRKCSMRELQALVDKLPPEVERYGLRVQTPQMPIYVPGWSPSS